MVSIHMDKVTVSSEYQIVIPSAIREELHLRPGDRLRVVQFGQRIGLFPVRSNDTMRGFLKGMDTLIEREGDRI